MKCLKPYVIPGTTLMQRCSTCAGCRLKRSVDWAIRCTHEATLHKENSFITLTYADEYLPEDYSLDKKVFQKFMKRFRKRLKQNGYYIKYFSCGEYGDTFGRPHYHFICFGYNPRLHAEYDISGTETDGRLLQKNDILSDSWPYGYVNVKEFNFQRAQYVAKYIMKKLGGEKAEEYERIGIEPEVGLMSRNIGYGYLQKYKGAFKDVETIYINGKELPIPRYYKRKLQEEHEANPKLRNTIFELERRKKVSQFRIRESQEITKRARAKGNGRTTSQCIKDIIRQRNKDFETKQIKENIRRYKNEGI